MTNRIPKIIHYCWFGPGFMPKQHVECVKQWKCLMPDYKFMKWDESTFDINLCEYTRQAYAAGKYAFVSDVARCWALYKYGGIYLDTDVQVFQSLDGYRKHGFFTAIEKFPAFESEGLPYLDSHFKPKDLAINVPYFGVLSAVLGSVESHPLMADMLSYYGITTSYSARMVDKQTRGGGIRSNRWCFSKNVGCLWV
ncbi:MAG: hypothetical protein MJZ20_04890 [Bacteroidaceae bacterium]|nr:hypothetical protein [Bacteroidaceae bacterium]